MKSKGLLFEIICYVSMVTKGIIREKQ